MPYPASPWTLKGYALQTLQLVDIDRIRSLIPPEFKIISVGFGKTIGGIYLAIYQAGSTLEYHELIVNPALVSYGKQSGGWVSHIYVDNPDSVAGGREIWGLPKELATFQWDDNNCIIVSQDSKQLCSLNYQPANWSFPLHLNLSAFGVLGANILTFQSDFTSNLSLIKGNLNIPSESPFAHLGLEKPSFVLSLKHLTLVADTPKIL